VTLTLTFDLLYQHLIRLLGIALLLISTSFHKSSVLSSFIYKSLFHGKRQQNHSLVVDISYHFRRSV